MLLKKLLIAFLLASNLLLAYHLFFGEQGVFAYFEIKKRYGVLQEELASAERRGQALSNEIRRLKGDRGHVQDMVRNRMNYLKDGEVLYIFPDQPAPGAAEKPTPGAAADGN